MAVQYAFGKIITQGLDLNVDAADPTSYPGSGTSWTNVVNRSITGSVISCSFSSDYKGGLVFNNPSASVVFPGTIANYGTSSFTVEMAFRPDQINGIHYLVSKNSGSYPNWGVYLSGSGGSGKLFSFYNIDATVSCSVSSSSTFVTGSNYFVDTIFEPAGKVIYINVDGNYNAISVLGNGTGSLTTTGSLFLGNLVASSSQAYSGSIFNIKTYSTFTSGYTNFKSISPRINKPVPVRPSTALALVIGGGGAGGGYGGMNGGGGAGGFVLSSLTLTTGTYNVFVGAGGNNSNGQTSSIANIVAYGGGNGGSYAGVRAGSNGASGGGAGPAGSPGSFITGGLAIYGTQGNNGGGSDFYSNSGGGGGGGAGAPGGSGAGTNAAGAGGAGLGTTISGILTYYAGGGGGGAYSGTAVTPGSGGLGGGGNGSRVYAITGQSGAPNTGGGGGGSDYQAAAYSSGGSGIVIIRYSGPQIATGGTITSVGGDTIHTFTATGSHTFTVL